MNARELSQWLDDIDEAEAGAFEKEKPIQTISPKRKLVVKMYVI